MNPISADVTASMSVMDAIMKVNDVVADDAGVVRPQKGQVPRLAEVHLHRGEPAALEGQGLEPCGPHQALQLLKQVLVGRRVHVREEYL